MKEPKHTHVRERFMVGWGMLAVAAVAAMTATIMVAKHRVPGLPKSTKPQATFCASVSCASLGDTVTYVLHGQVTQVQSPQAGVICVQVSSQKSGGDYCELASPK